MGRHIGLNDTTLVKRHGHTGDATKTADNMGGTRITLHTLTSSIAYL